MPKESYIELSLDGKKYRMDVDDDADADELKVSFSRLLVCADFWPSVIEADGGEFAFVADDEKIVSAGEDK